MNHRAGPEASLCQMLREIQWAGRGNFPVRTWVRSASSLILFLIDCLQTNGGIQLIQTILLIVGINGASRLDRYTKMCSMFCSENPTKLSVDVLTCSGSKVASILPPDRAISPCCSTVGPARACANLSDQTLTFPAHTSPNAEGTSGSWYAWFTHRDHQGQQNGSTPLPTNNNLNHRQANACQSNWGINTEASQA